MNNKNTTPTQIYTHVSTEQLGKILSHLDKLKLNEWKYCATPFQPFIAPNIPIMEILCHKLEKQSHR
jgi:hypothetical protein